MVGILIKIGVGVALFVGSLVGGLAATGRLNHEGTANIPVLSSFFPAPEESPHEGGDGEHAAEDGDTHAAEASAGHESGEPAEASHPQDPKKRLPKMGPSFRNKEEPKSSGGHGGGHGDEASADHADTSHAAGAQHPAPAGETANKPQKAGQRSEDQRSEAERDFERTAESAGKTGYRPGAYFQFGGMPAGLTPEQLNEAWQTVQKAQKEVEQKRFANELKEAELKEFANDISRRQKALGAEQLRLEKYQKDLEEKIRQFQETVLMVKDTEVAKLKRNAETMAAFERSKAAELIQQQWSSESGQAEILKLLEFMDRDAVNEILSELPNPMVQDILKKRMTVAREATAAGK